jgi:hypothetical protein
MVPEMFDNVLYASSGSQVLKPRKVSLCHLIFFRKHHLSSDHAIDQDRFSVVLFVSRIYLRVIKFASTEFSTNTLVL